MGRSDLLTARCAISTAGDSQDDRQAGGWLWTNADESGIGRSATELQWTVMDARAFRGPGLQNRLRGAVEASWVGSIPIHPPPNFVAVTAKMTATEAACSERSMLSIVAPSRKQQTV